jgi:hypothetical protein
MKKGVLIILFFSIISNIEGQILIENYTGLQKEKSKEIIDGEVLLILKARKMILEVEYINVLEDSLRSSLVLKIDTLYHNKASNKLLEVVICTEGSNNLKVQYLLDKDDSKFMQSLQDRFHVIYSGKGVNIRIRNKWFLNRYLSRNSGGKTRDKNE